MRGYIVLELRRLLRSPLYLLSSVGMPLVMYLLFTNLGFAGDKQENAIYTMVSMAGFGAIGAALMNGMSVVQDRGNGWLRQLRITPLTAGRVVVDRGLTGMLVGLPAILAVCVLGGLANGVHLPAARWGEIVGLLWLGTAPFALLGLGIGYLVSISAAQPITMLLNLGMSALGGLWVPASLFPKFLRTISTFIPTSGYGNVVRQVAFNTKPQMADIAVLAGWFVVFIGLAAVAYRRSGRSVTA